MAFNSIKYLASFGWSSIVLSTKKENKNSLSLPKDIFVYRTSAFENIFTQVLFYLGILVDSKIIWFFSATRKAKRVLRQQDIDVIISRSTPVTSHLIGWRLKAAMQIPWIACFSDPWTQNPYLSYPLFLRKIHEFFERAVINNADRIVVTTEQTKALLLKKYEISEKIRVIPNSYDALDIPKKSKGHKINKFIITHVGNFYGMRSPEPFLRALAHSNEGIKNEMEVRFIGHFGSFKKLISKYRLDEVVQLLGTIPQRDAFAAMSDSDILLLIDAASGQESVFLPAKLVEYVGMEKPILAITPIGASADVVHSTNTGVVVSPEDENGIQRAIEEYYDAWKNSKLAIHPNRNEIKKYTAEAYAEKLNVVIQEII